MPLTPITMRSTREPFRLRLASTSQSSVQVVAPATVTFLDDNSTVSYQPGSAPSATAKSIYDGAATVDGTRDNWLLLAVKGTPYPVWVKERDFGTMEALLAAADWAPLRMLAEGRLSPLFLEAGGGSSLPTPLLTGSLLYVDPTTHKPTWVQGTQGDIWRYENGIWERLPIGNVGDLLHVATGPHGKQPVWAPVSGALTPPGVVISSTPGVGLTLSLVSGGAGSVPADSNAPPPAGWSDPGASTSGWHASVAETDTLIAVPPTPAQYITVADGDWEDKGEWLLRYPFSLPLGLYNAATMWVSVDLACFAFLINGHAYSPPVLGGYYVDGGNPAFVSFPVSLADLFLGTQPNLLAVHVGNDTAVISNPSSIAFQLVLS